MKNIIKYILLAVFALVQVQAFAYNNSSDLWKKVSLKEETNWLLFSGKGVFTLNNNIYNLLLDVNVSNSCVSVGTSQSYSYTIKIINTGITPVVLTSSSQISVVILQPEGATGGFTNLSGSTLNGILGSDSTGTVVWNWSRDSGYNYTFKYPSTGSVTIAPNSFVSFNVSRDYLLTSGQRRILFANLSFDNNVFSETTVGVYRVPSSPSGISKQLHPNSTYTLQTATGLTAEDLAGKIFYKNNIKVDPQEVISLTDLGGYTYKNTNGTCESGSVNITLTVSNGPFPNPGSINAGSNPIICYNTPVTISNGGSASYLIYSFNYSWEISYDSGVTWITVNDQMNVNSVNGSSITFNNVTSDFKIRRKAKADDLNSTSLLYAYSNTVSIEVYPKNIIFPEGVDAYYIQEGGSFSVPNFGLVNPDMDFQYQLPTGMNLSNLSKGDYFITIIGTTKPNSLKSGCIITDYLKLIVYDSSDCNNVIKRVFAKKVIPWKSLLGATADNPLYAVNGDRAQAAQIFTVLDALGLGSSGIDLYFTDENNQLIDIKGKKVTLKMGENYSGLDLAGGISVTGRWLNDVNRTQYVTGDLAGVASSSNYKSVGPTVGVKGGVLSLLRGDNVYEFSFVPTLRSTENSNQVINGVRVQAGSLLSVGSVNHVFYAFIEEDVALNLNNPCNSSDIEVNPAESLKYPLVQKGKLIRYANESITLNKIAEDATWGNYTEVLNVASGLSSVTFPYYAIDNDYNSYAIFNTTAGVLNKQFLNVRLRQLARPGDQVQITLGTEGVNVLNLSLLNLVNHKIKFYLGDALVDEQTLDRFKVLDLGLLDFDASQKLVISKPITVPFDRIQLEQWNTVSINLGNQLYIYDIRTNPQMMFTGQSDPNQVTEVCAADYLKISKMDVCTSFDIQFAYVPENGFGGQLRDELGNLMFDKQGNPIFSIISQPIIINSTAIPIAYSKNNVDYFEIDSLYSQYKGRLVIKIQSKRYGCNYGSPQYLRINLTNCDDAIVNPVIKSGANY